MPTVVDTKGVYWVDSAADVEIRNGITCWSFGSGGIVFELRASPAVLLESIRRSTQVYNQFAREAGQQIAVFVSKDDIDGH